MVLETKTGLKPNPCQEPSKVILVGVRHQNISSDLVALKEKQVFSVISRGVLALEAT